MLVLISSSGNSWNLVKAARMAKELGVRHSALIFGIIKFMFFATWVIHDLINRDRTTLAKALNKI